MPGALRTGVIDSCESPQGCWKLNGCPVEEKPVLLITEFNLNLSSPWPIFNEWVRKVFFYVLLTWEYVEL